jgi:hypothetical protein
MNRGIWLALVAPLVLAAAPAPRGSLPLPPIPPAHPPTDGPAPMPDRDASAPQAPAFEGPTITPRVVRIPTFNNLDPSQGYISGSRLQEDAEADRRLTLSPGLNLRLPFR